MLPFLVEKEPAAQSMHAGWAFVGCDWPRGQRVQRVGPITSVTVVRLKEPGSQPKHSVVPVELENLPARWYSAHTGTRMRQRRRTKTRAE